MVGKLGRTRHRAHPPNATGSWAASINAVNGLARDLLWPTAEMVRGRSRCKRRSVCGDFLHVREVVNTMVDRLNSFASEATRVAREAGTEGKLGGQSSVKGVAGIWKDLGRQRQSHGRKFNGSQYCRGDHRCRQWRSLQEDRRPK
jgi:hypothetical protein